MIWNGEKRWNGRGDSVSLTRTAGRLWNGPVYQLVPCPNTKDTPRHTPLTLPALALRDPFTNAHAQSLAYTRIHLVLETRRQHLLNTLLHVLRDDVERGSRVRVSRVERQPQLFAERHAA